MAKSFRPFSIVFDQNGKGGVPYQTVQDFAGKSKVTNYFSAYEIVVGDVVNSQKSEYIYSGNIQASRTRNYKSATNFVSAYDISFDSPLIQYTPNTKFSGSVKQSTTPAGYISTGGTLYLGSNNLTQIAVDTRTNTYTSTLRVSTRDSAISTNIISTRTSSYTFGSVDGLGFVSFAPNPPENIQLFDVTVSNNIITSKTYQGTGQILSSGSANVPNTYRVIGRNNTAYQSAYNIVLGNEENINQISSGNSRYIFIPSGVFGSGTFTSNFSDLNGSTAKVYFAPILVTLLLDANALTARMLRYGGKSPTTPFGASDIIFEQIEANAPPTSPKFTSSSVVSETNSYNGFISANEFKGSGSVIQTKLLVYEGAGSFSTSSAAAQVYGPNPPESTELFNFTGSLVEKQTDITSGSETLLISGGETRYNTFRHIGASRIAYYSPQQIVFADGESFYPTEFKFTGTASYRKQTAVYFTSGSFSSASGLAEVFGANTPENIQLFQIYGGASLPAAQFSYNAFASASIAGSYSNLKSADAWVGTPRITYYEPYQIVFGNDELYYTTEFKLSSSSVIKNVEAFSGSGSLFATSGTAEAFGAQTPENIQLFSVTGAYNNFKFVKSTFSVGYSLTNLDIQGFISANVPSGLGLQIALETVTGSGSGAIVSYFSSGNQISFIEISSGGNGYLQGDVLRLPVGSNPTITLGNLVNDTNVKISGAATQSRLYPNYIGSSPVAYYSPQQIVFAEGESFYPTTLKLTGVAAKSSTPRGYNGSGTFSTASGLAESTGSNPPENIQLFNITGGASLPAAQFSYNAFASASIAGSYSNLKSADAWVGTPRIVYYEPYQIVFGSDELFYSTEFKLSSSSVIKNVEAFIGSGSFSTASGLAESIGSNTPDNIQLFSITGGYSDLKSIDILVGSETVNITGAATQSRLYPNYIGTSPIAYYNPQQIVFGEGELFYPTTLQLTGVAAKSTTPRGYSGTGTFSTTLGAAETFSANTPENIQLFQISGGASLPAAQFSYNAVAGGEFSISGGRINKNIYIFAGKSAVTYYSPQQIIFSDGELFYPNEFKYSGINTKYTSVSTYTASGTFSATSGAAEVYSPQPPENIQLFSVSGTCIEVFASQPPENIQLFNITGSYSNLKSVDAWVGTPRIVYYEPYQIVFGNDELYYTTEFKISNASVVRNTEALIGSGSLFTALGVAEAFVAQPPENIQLFQISGGASLPPATFTYNASVGAINITGTATQSRLYPNYIGFSPVAYYSPQQIVFADGESFYPTTLQLTGVAAKSTTPRGYNGSGTFSTASGLAEAFSANTPENIQLFSVTGGYSDFKNVDAWSGSETINISGSLVEKNTESYVGTPRITYYEPYQIVFGSDELFYTTEFKISNASVVRNVEVYSASGLFSTVSGASESTGSNPPENIQLFQIYGGASLPPATFTYNASVENISVTGSYSNLKSVDAWVGTPRIVYYEPYQIVFGSDELFYTTEFKLFNTASIKNVEAVVGSGSLFTASGLAEAFSSNTPENIQLFSVTGGYSELKSVDAWSGSETINLTGTATQSRLYPNYIGFSPVAYYSPEQIVFAEGESFYPTTLQLNGVAAKSTTPRGYNGSGTFSTASGLAEVFGANTPENIQLFQISGGASLPPATFSYNASVTASITGSYSNLKSVDAWIGTPRITYYEPYQIVFGNDELFYTTEFKISNASVVRNTEALIGGGSFSSVSGAAEAFGAQTPENIQLFSVTGGYSDFKNVDAWSGSETINITGAATQSRLYPNYIGSSPIAYYSPEQIVFAEGESFYPTTLKLTGVAAKSTTPRGYNGSGTFSSVSGASEAFGAQPPENIQLFNLSGTCVEVFASNTPENIQLFSITGSYSNIKSTDAWVGTSRITYYEPYQIVFGDAELFYTTEFKISNASSVRIVESFTGSGSLFTSSGTSEAFVAQPPENIQLFQIYGGASLPPATFTYNAPFATISITGSYSNLKSVDAWVGTPRIVYYEPYQIVFGSDELFYTTEFKLSSSSVIKNVEAFSGSGSLFTASGLAEAFSSNTPENIQLFSVTGGYSDFKNVDAWSGSETINITGAATQSRLYPNYIGFSPVAYYSPEQIVFAEGESFYPTTLKLTGVAAKSTTPRGYNGSGTFSTASGLAESTGSNTPENIQLFQISGGASLPAAQFSYNAPFATINITGAATQSRLYPNYIGFSPVAYYSPEQIVFAEGESFYPTTLQLTGVAAKSTTPRGYNGSGTFSTASGLAESTGSNTPENIQLFSVTGGYSDFKNVDAWSGSETINISGIGQTPRTKVYTGFSPVAYYSPQQIVFADGESFYPTTLQLTGTASYQKPVFVYTGTGSILSPISGAAQSVSANTPENTQLFSITGSSTLKLRDWIYISPSVLIDPNDIVFDNYIYDYDDININYRIWNTNTNRYDTNPINISRSYIGTSTFSIASGLVEAFSANTPENIQLFNITGGASVPLSARIIGSGTFSATSGAAESYSAQTPENIQLFNISDSASYKNTDAYNGTSSVEITGAYSDLKSVDAWSGFEQIIITGSTSNIFSYAYSGQVTPILAGLAGTASVTFNPPENTQLFDIQINSSSSTTVGLYTGTGTILSPITGLAEVFVANPPENTQLFSITGNAIVPVNPIIIGSGSLFTASGASQSTGANPPENTQLFTISVTSTEKHSDVTIGAGTVTISGAVIETNTESYVGTGSLFTASGASQSTSSNPPENTQLFNITVSGVFNTTVGVYTASASYEFTGAYSNLKSVDAWNGNGTATISGDASYRFGTGIYTGTGQINISGAATPVIGSNPPENTQLFSITGADTESQTDITSGSGSLFTASGASQSTGSNPPENTQLFSITGAYSDIKATDAWSGSGTTTISGGYSDFKNVDAWSGSGTITISGTTAESQTDITSGSGSLFTASGASQSTGANPPENTQLFSITGAYSDIKATDAWSGSGSLFTASGATEAYGANPPENTQLFSITGSATIPLAQKFAGSGSLFTASGATEVFVANPPENTQLFSVTGGYSDLKSVDVLVGSGTFSVLSGAAQSYSAQTPENIQLLDISVSSIQRVNYSIVSSGSLFTEITSTASVTFNPSENTQLFSVTGGYSDLKSIDILVGSGTFSVLSGAAQSVGSNPPENTMLFVVSGSVFQTSTSNNIGTATTEITGSATNIQFKASYSGNGTTNINGSASVAVSSKNIQSGSIFTAGGHTEVFGSNPPENTQLFSVTGAYSNLKSVDAWVGSGTFSAVGGHVEVFGVNPPENIQLFTFGGEADEKFETSSYQGRGTIYVASNAEHSFSKIAKFDAGTIDINATSNKSISYGKFIGSGSLFELVSNQQNVTFVPAVGIVIPEETPLGSPTLFTLYGSANVQFATHAYQGTGIININVNVVVRTRLPEKVFVTII
jgi:hypothetical protein